MTRKLIYLAIIILFAIVESYSQQKTKLYLLPSNPEDKHILKKIKFKTEAANELDVMHEVSNIQNQLFSHGYLLASIDSICGDSIKKNIFSDPGGKYILKKLSIHNIEKLALRNSGLKPKHFRNSAFNYDRLAKLLNRLLTYYEDNGYPFATVKLDSVEIQNDTIEASLQLIKNDLISIDTLIITADANINIQYLYQYLGIKPGDEYNESKIADLGKKINDIQFISESKPFEIAFTPGKATIFLYLSKIRASQFDGILGLAPNEETTGKLLLTGDIKLNLINTFKRGETIALNWKKLEEKTQELDVHFNYPYLFRTPFGVDYRFHLFKKDSSYLSVQNQIGIHYIFEGRNFIKAFYESLNSSLISTTGLEFATTLPEYADIKTSLYGLGFYFETLDYYFNPFKGFYINTSGAVGDKKIKKNNNVNPVLYDSLQLKSTQYKINLEAANFFPLFRKATLLIKSQNGYIDNPNLFNNELFRIGGLKSLRGFDEESMLASFYSILTVEFRYLFEKNSYFNLFWNGAYYEKRSINEFIADRPYGFGLGLSFATKAGIFSVNYALGKQFNNPVDLKNAKIHFGITASF